MVWKERFFEACDLCDGSETVSSVWLMSVVLDFITGVGVVGIVVSFRPIMSTMSTIMNLTFSEVEDFDIWTDMFF